MKKIIIQCAKGKQEEAGSFKQNGKPVKFCADPNLAPEDEHLYAHPDDKSENGRTWRELLVEYNQTCANENPLGLLPAYCLYKRKRSSKYSEYQDLVKKFGKSRVFILSAGWGLIRSDYLIPDYDVTFSSKGKEYAKRKRKIEQKFKDFNQLPADDGEDTVFLGGEDYRRRLLYKLIKDYTGNKLVFYQADPEKPNVPHVPAGFEVMPYRTKTKTNWHYECAEDLIDGKLSLND